MTTPLDTHISALAEKYTPLARQILAEAIRIPADYVDKSEKDGGDPRCGTSNHEFPRIEYLRKMIIKHKAVESPDDVCFDGYGNLRWIVEDKSDTTPRDKKKVVYFEGHTDTVNALRPAWTEKVKGADCYNGLTDASALDREFLESQLGYLPPPEEYKHAIFGRGSADQLAGVVGEIVASKIMLELKSEGALKGVIVVCYGTIAEEDNDGGGPMYVIRKDLKGASADRVPDCVIHTEGTGCSNKGALGIYRGHRGRMQIEVDIIGKSCHGSMPWMGINPLEYGAKIIVEATERHEKGIGFKDDPFLHKGTRVASDAHLATPSDCAVPERFTFRFDRRLTTGETPAEALADIENLPSVAAARAAGCIVNVHVPRYTQLTWKGVAADNDQIYMSWQTPEDHPAIVAAVEAYKRVITPVVAPLAAAAATTPGLKIYDPTNKAAVKAEPRVDAWIFSTDGVGYPLPETDTTFFIPATKKWVHHNGFKHPAMFGFGAGYEQNTHKIGEWSDEREIQHAIALYTRFPSLFAEMDQ